LGAALQAAWVVAGGGRKNLRTITNRHIRLDRKSLCRPTT
jgi:hypothetical protein